jgi:hypothetical protein
LPLRIDENERRAGERHVPIVRRSRQAQRPFEPRVVVADELGEVGRRRSVRAGGSLREQDRGIALLRVSALHGAAQPKLAEQPVGRLTLSRQLA